MRLLQCLCLGTILSTFGGPLARMGTDLAFEDVGPQPQPSHPFAAFSALLEIEPNQRLGDTNGILFTVELHNGSKRPIRLTNPLDTLDYSLTDEDGRPLQLPSRGFLKLRVNTRRPVDTQAFRLVSLEIDGERVTERDNHSETVTLPADASYRISLSVEEVRKSSSDMSPVPIRSGDYTISVFLALATADGSATRTLRTPSLRVSLDANQ